jgi:hypothetical protein
MATVYVATPGPNPFPFPFPFPNPGNNSTSSNVNNNTSNSSNCSAKPSPTFNALLGTAVLALAVGIVLVVVGKVGPQSEAPSRRIPLYTVGALLLGYGFFALVVGLPVSAPSKSCTKSSSGTAT